MELEPTDKFTKQYRKKSKELREKVEKAMALLETDPRYPGLHTHRVQGTVDIFECYIDDTYRITFEYGQNCIVLRNNCDHNATLKNP